MKHLLLVLTSMLGITFGVHAGALDAYPSGPSNLLPTGTSTFSKLWVGNDVAKALFDGMVDSSKLNEGIVETRIGQNVACSHDPVNGVVEYSCVLIIENSTGAVSSL